MLIKRLFLGFVEISDTDITYTMWISFAEIYNENIYDLLKKIPEAKKKGEKVRRTPLKMCDDRNGSPYIKGLTEIQVTELLTLVSHYMNAHNLGNEKYNLWMENRMENLKSIKLINLLLTRYIFVLNPLVPRVQKIKNHKLTNFKLLLLAYLVNKIVEL